MWARPPTPVHRTRFAVHRLPSTDVTLAPHNLLIGARRRPLPVCILTPPTHNLFAQFRAKGSSNPFHPLQAAGKSMECMGMCLLTKPCAI